MAYYNVTVYLTNCIVSNNSANAEGGALYVEEPIGAWIHSCTFLGNTASKGGAVYSRSTTNFAFDVQHCNFRGNTASESSGALDMKGMSIYLSDSLFSGNNGPLAGATYFAGPMTILSILNCRIKKQNNVGKTRYQVGHGSAVYVFQSNKTIIGNTIFEHNDAGGGLILAYSGAEIYNCSFHNNSGFAAGAILAVMYPFVLVIRNTSFVDNKGPLSSALSLNNHQTLIEGCKFNRTNPTLAVVEITTEKGIDLRFSKNTFFEPHVQFPSQLESVVSLASNREKVIIPGTVYFWENTLQFVRKPCLLTEVHWKMNQS